MIDEFKAKLLEIYERFRCWIDNEPFLSLPFTKDSSADIFARKIETEIKNVMQREKFRYQDGKILLPTNYFVLISDEDGCDWKGVKRASLEQRLKKFTSNQIQSVSADCTYMFHDHVVTMRTEKTFKKGEIKVLHKWAENDVPVEILIASQRTKAANRSYFLSGETTGFSLKQAETLCFEGDEETIVKQRAVKLFCLEIWRNGICQNIIPIYRNKISVGRGSCNTFVDVSLKGDPEISRLHLILTRHDNKSFNILVQGKNPVLVKQQKFFAEQMTAVLLDEDIKIGSYLIRVKN